MGKKDKNSRDPRSSRQGAAAALVRAGESSVDRSIRMEEFCVEEWKLDREGRICVEPARSGIIGESAAGSPLRARYELLFFVSLKFTSADTALISVCGRCRGAIRANTVTFLRGELLVKSRGRGSRSELEDSHKIDLVVPRETMIPDSMIRTARG